MTSPRWSVGSPPTHQRPAVSRRGLTVDRRKTMADLSRVLKQHNLDVSSLREFEEFDDIRLLTVPGEEAIALWKRLRGLVDETGRWPVLLGSEEDLEMHLENLEESDGDLEGVLS